MNFLYCSDLHGSVAKYEAVFKYALDLNVKTIHIGADILPKGSCILEMQKDFINKYLKNFYQKAKEKNIDILAGFGNDDVYTRKIYFRKYAKLLDEVPYKKEEYTFKAYNFVPDYMFGLKTGVKHDFPGWTCPEPYISKPVDFTDQGIVFIENTKEYFLKKGTIEEDLNKIEVDNKTIMAIHCPPHGLSLDVCHGGRRVGSKAVYEWILKEQPLMVLSGHIHESYDISKIWKVKLGSTLIIQPGQPENKTRIVLIQILDNEICTELIEI